MSRRRPARAQKKKRATKVSVAPAKLPNQRNFVWWLLGGILFAAVVFAYQNAWSAGYIWDDDMYVTNNPLLTAANGLRRIWFSFDAPSQYFPLTYTTFWIEHALWGFAPAGYHWDNILLHATNALLLWRLLRALNVRGAWFAAALFALHPVQVESVAWVTERKNVLMGFFFLTSLLAWVRFVDEKEKRSYWWLALTFVLYLLALSAKTTACTLPAALVLILWWQRKPLTIRRWLQIAPFLLAGVGGGIISVLWERIHQGGRPDFIPIPFIERILIGSRAIWFYLSKLVWPSELIFSYPRWDISRTHPADYFWLIALGVLIGVIVYARRRFGRGPEVAFTFFVLTLSPLLGVVIVVTFLYSFVADHYQYLACIGPLTLFAAAVSRPAWLARTSAVIVLAILGFLTWQQTKMYRNEETLWVRTIAQNPGSWMARNNLAGYWLGQKRFDEAIDQYREIIALRTNDSLGHMNLGAALARKGDAAAAIEEYEKARALEPDDPRLERNFGQAVLTLGRIDEAIAHFERAVELRKGRKDPNGQNPELQFELGNAFLQKGDSAEAISHYRNALELRPDYAIAHNNLGSALLKEGAVAEAKGHFEEANKLDPGSGQNAEIFCNLGNASLQKRDFETAIANYRQALAIRANYPEAHSNLGTALLLQGKFADAIAEFETTLKLAPQSTLTLNNLARLLATAPNESLRDGARAARLAQQAIELTGGRDPSSYRALAAARAQEGEFEEAEKAVEQAINLAGESNAAFTDVLRREKESYRGGRKP
ncbi:MAG: tetratricopeptide repeat protein [Verrucomicrobiota bacterium]|nr:tetratricopeptide repeat protein [Verrucomicrobiota bacterium]